MEIKGIAAIVTGGASGLGAATAQRLAAAGARVTIFDLDVELGAAHAKALGGHFVKVDVIDEAAVTHGLEEAEGLHGKARILVNCAGIGPPAKAIGRNGQALPLKNFVRVINVNLIGTFNVAFKFAARICQSELVGEERAIIIDTASVAAFDSQIGQAAYSASKGGIVGLTLPLAREFARYGIRVMTIAPGIFLTPLLMTLRRRRRIRSARRFRFQAALASPLRSGCWSNRSSPTRC
jgi:NAD(P)-dependent dehydrogenase (short-subunit alcohol dehydrogenase family)